MMRTGLHRLLAALLLTSAATLFARPPNVLIVINDDQSWLECGAYGKSSVPTPYFDRVAKDGVLFRNGYCSAPSCAPARAALLTGRNFWELEQGAIIQAWLPAKYATLPEMLVAAGYHAGYTGKGWGPGVKEPTGKRDDPAGKAWNSQRVKAPRKGISPVDYAANFKAFLAAKPKDSPFYFWAGLTEPHAPWGPDNHKEIGVDLKDLKLPEFLPDTKGVRINRANYLYEVQHADRTLGAILKLLEEAGELENTLVIVTADNGTPVPRAKANVYDWGVHVPLAMMWPARAPGGRTVTDFVGFPDLAPTILEAAGLKVAPEMTGRSLLPTLASKSAGRIETARDFTVNGLEWHGNLPPTDIAARMIRDDRFQYIVNYSATARGDESESGRKPAAHFETHSQRLDTLPIIRAYPDRPDIRPYYDLILAPRPREELYDCVADPDQVRNLADKPEFADIKQRLRTRLEAYQRQTGDPRITGKMTLFNETQRYVEKRKAAGYDDDARHDPKADTSKQKTK